MKNREQAAIALIRKGLQAAKLDRSAQTIEYLGEGLRSGASHYTYWAFYAVALGNLARYKEAGSAFRKALRLSKGEKQSSICSAFADALEKQGRLGISERYHRRAVQLRPRHAGAWIRWGAFLACRGRLDEAERCHRKATTLREGCVDEAFMNLGNIYRAKGKYRQARDCYLRALKLDPGYEFAKAALRDVAPLV